MGLRVLATQGMKTLKGPTTPGARSQSGDTALWASPDTEWGAGAGAGASGHPKLSPPIGLVLTLGPHLRDLRSQVWVTIAPTGLETSGRWPWPPSTHQPSWLGSGYRAPPSSTSQLGSGPETRTLPAGWGTCVCHPSLATFAPWAQSTCLQRAGRAGSARNLSLRVPTPIPPV